MDRDEVSFFSYYKELETIRKELMDFSLQNGLGSNAVCLFNRNMSLDAPIKIDISWIDTGIHNIEEAKSMLEFLIRR